MPFILNKSKETDDFCELLEKTGRFDKLEIKTLSAMLFLEKGRQPKNSASDISKKAEMSVTNAYKYLYSLQQKGLVESDSGKNKIFWLARTNPFQRMFSYVSREYLEKKEVFGRLKEIYDRSVSGKEIWMGKQIFERYSKSQDFTDKAALVLDIAQQEVLIMAEDIEEDFVLMDSIKRAIERGVKIRMMNSNMPEERIALMRKMGVELRYMDRIMQPFTMVADGRHGITIEMKGSARENSEMRGTWFLNHDTDYRKKFDALWEKAGTVI
jgi:sugar-specific transcriptional regulator TrmB